ncbi:PQQ-binding-like beta-propeller repeat protein [Actinoplanes sp. TRM 88003]|uniref:PQQ-binding-like beta-propeller repeat protein n=1 Tax=Paractinoplanes aksuensis TaxID=2939490 RepID=A0ABT1DQ36_9ACTN|nr:PQQ-binding-like beta-propeller repeat protein [Actinoplanes aksuensis]MCO8272125.1 PQQ-binding-like beta-propeller repeat protein [Actinoplanes aksuensis]
MSTIELGEMPTAGDDRPAPAGSARFDRRLVRQIALVVAALLCAVTLTGAEVPRAHGLRPLWSVATSEAQGTALSRDSLFVYRTADSVTTIVAHDLRTGAIRWQRTLNGAIGYIQPADDAGMLLIPTEGRLVELPSANDGTAFQAEVHGATVAVSIATGEELWRTDGEPYTVSHDTALMTQFSPGAALRRIRLIRLSDRSTIWSRDTAGVRNYLSLPMNDRPDKVVTATDVGEIKIYAYASGALLSEARIPWVTPRPDEGFFNDLTGTSEILVVNRSQANTFDMSVYRTDTMAELWRAPHTDGYAFACGAALCVNGGQGVVAYDMNTGAQLWRLADAANAWPLNAERVAVGEGADDGAMRLVDAGTGRVVGEPASGTLAWNETQEGTALVLRPTESPAGRTAVTRWDLRTGRQWLLGSIAPVAGPPCSVRTGILACNRGDSYEVIAVG